MARERITLDLAQCEVFNHLPPMKAGILIKAVVSYCTKSDVASWGADADLKPIFLTLKETIEKCREEDNVKQDKDKRSERNRRYYLRRIKTIQTIKTSYKESENERERDEEKVILKEEEKEKVKEKEKSEVGCINTSSSSSGEDDPKRAEKNKKNLEKRIRANAIIDYYNEQVTAKGAKLQFCKARTEKRISSIMARLQEYGEESLRQTIDKAIVSRFLNYEASNAPMSLEWIMKPNNFPKVMEGMYDDRDRRQQQRTPHGTSVAERAYNMLHFEYEGHPEMWKEERKKMAEFNKAFE